MQLDNNSLIMQWNVDTNGNPVSRHIAREVQQISPTHNLIQLTQIPDNYYPVRIVTEDNIELTEVKHRNDITETTFYIEYGLGLVYFHESLSGKMIVTNYYGRGVMLISDSRIFHKDGDTITDTWDNIIKRSQDALDLIEHAGGLADAIEIIDQKVQQGNQVADRLEDFITETQFYGYTITLSRESFVVKADDDGEVGKTEISSVYTDVLVYKGAKQIIPTLTVSNEKGCTFKIEGQRVTLTNIDINFIKTNAILNIDCGDGLVAQRVLEVTKVFDGVSQYQVSMSNPFFSFQSNADGIISESQSVICSLKVIKANVEYTNYTIQVQNAPQGLNYNVGSDSVTFTSEKGRLLPTSGTCLVVLSIDGQTFNNSFSWNKTKKGQDAGSLVLVGSQIIRYETPDFSDIPSQTKTTISAKISGLSGTPKWSFYNGVEWIVLENEIATDLTFMHNDQFIWADRKEVIIRCELGEYSDELTIVKLTSGVNGKDAVSVILTNESHTIPIDDSGLVANSEIEKARTTVMACRGIEEVLPVVTKGRCDGCDISINQNVVQLTSLDNSFTSSTAELLVNVDGVVVTKMWTISKSKQGQQGQDGQNGSSYILNVTGGTRSVTYGQINQDPRPSMSQTFTGSLYENGVEIVDNVSWYWVSNGHFEGNSILETFTPNIRPTFDDTMLDNSISVMATYNGQTLTQVIPLSVTKDASGIEWVKDWDSTKTEVRGNVILTPKIFAGHYDKENDLVTGFAIGQDVLSDGRTVGVVGYQNNEVSVLLDVDGSFQIGNPFEENSVGMYYSNGAFKAKLTELAIEGVSVPNKNDISDMITSEVASAKNDLKISMDDMISTINSIENTVNNTLRDGILTEVEKGELKTIFTALNGEVTTVSSQTSSILGNPFLSNLALLESLTKTYDTYMTTYNTLVDIYNRILLSDKPTGDDIALFNTTLLTFRETSELLNQILINCLTNISHEQANKLVDDAKTEIKAEVSDVSDALGALETTINGEFKAGLVTSINLANLDNHLLQLAKEKADVDGQYSVMFNNPKLSATIKQQLIQAKSEYDISHDALVAKINSVVLDNLITEIELKAINELITAYAIKLGSYSSKAQEANADIALQSAQGAIDALDQETIFNKLTNNGEKQGIYLQERKVYVNGEYVNTRNFTAVRDDGTETFKIDSEGDAIGRFKSFYLTGDDTNVPTKDYVDDEISKVSIGNVNVMLSNEAQVIATSNTRVPLSSQSFSTTVKAYMGTKEVADFTIGTIASADGITVSVAPLTKVVTFTVATNTAITKDSGAFTIPVVLNGKTYNKEWSWAVSRQGDNGYSGSNGTDGVDGQDAPHVIVNGEQIFKYSNNFTGTPTPSNITLSATKINTNEVGKWQYKNVSGVWTDWKNGEVVQTGLTLLVSPTSYNLATEKAMAIRYIVGSIYDEITIVKVSDGVNGTNGKDGIDGVKGQDGVSTYFHVRYSTNADGSGMTLTPTTNSKYMGVCSTTSKTAPTDKTSYSWSLIKGDDGQSGSQGEKGEDGRTSYLHIKYSNDGGATFTSNNGEDVGKWIGTYVDFSQTDSSSVLSYEWKKFIGEDGVDGVKGADGISTYFHVRYSVNADGSSMTASPTSYTKYMGTVSTTSSTAPSTPSSYVWSLIKGSDGEKGITGAKGEDGRSSYLHVKYSDNGQTFTSNNGETVGKYIGTYVDYTEADSNVFSAYTWKKFVGEDGKGVKSIQEQYYLSTSMTSLTGGSWVATAPTASRGKYIWTRSAITYTDNTTNTTTPVCVSGADGSNGSNGEDGISITSVDVEYGQSSSSTSVPASWTTTAPAWSNGKYIWCRTKTTYSNGSVSITNPACITGQKGENGSNGADGQDAITVVLSNETHSFPCENNGNIPTALTTTCVATAYKGSASATPTIGTITNPTGMTITKSGTTLTIQANVGTSLADNGSVNIPITVDGKTFTKTFSWSKAKKGANGSNGSNGADAKTVDILASSQVFKSTDGGKTFSPDTINLTPNLQNVTYSNWQYSVNGGNTWSTVTSGTNGLTISGNVLTINKSSALFTSLITSIVFRVNTSVSSVYDTMTIVRLYDVTEMSQEDVFNKLTNNGQTQGIYLESGKIYINGEYIKANSFIADMITSGTFRGTNFEVGGSGNNGLILAKDSDNNVVFSASKIGVFATNMSFVDEITNDGNFITSASTIMNSTGYSYSISESNSSYTSRNSLNFSGTTFITSSELSRTDGTNSENSVQITPTGVTLKNEVIVHTLGLESGYSTLTGRVRVKGDGTNMRFTTGTNGGTSYVDWYTDGMEITRSGWMGYGSSSHKNFTIKNEIGSLELQSNSSINVHNAIDMNKNEIRNLYRLKGRYNGETILSDHNNSNVTLSALGGRLYLGYENTTDIAVQKDLIMNAGSTLAYTVSYSSGVGNCSILEAGNGDSGSAYGTHNMFSRCHWTWGIKDQNGATNMYIDARSGKWIGKAGSGTSSSRILKSDIRAITSENTPMAVNLKFGETVDENITIESITDFLDTIGIRTYTYDYQQDGYSQEEIPLENGGDHLLQLGFIADEIESHPLFKYIGEKGEDGIHTIDTLPMITATIAGYQYEKQQRLLLENRVLELEGKLLLIEEKIKTI